MELFSEVDKDISEEKVHSLLCDAITYLFGGDTVSILVQEHGVFTPVLTAGSLRKHVESISLSRNNAISEAVEKRRTYISTEAIELLRLGYPEAVTSIHLFPLSVKDETYGLLAVFNSQFEKEDMETITKLCWFTTFLLTTIISHKIVRTKIDSLTAMNLALDLSPAFQNPDMLYETIVEVSSQLINAERASLMLPEEEQMELLIKAVKGINKWIAKNIRVRVGEGIAGRVYKEGRPLIVTDIERNLSTHKKPSYRTGSFVCIPLKIGDETIGVLNFADKGSGEVFSEADMEFIRYFASYASIAIKGSQYYSMSEEMRTLSITDSLTGLFNRRYFDDRFFQELQRTIRYDSMFSLAIFDIDDFKLFNDTEGHAAGDEVLKAVSDISRESLRSIDILARFGGEEFAIIMPQTEKNEAFFVAERVRKNIKELMPVRWKNFPREAVTVSIGIAAFPADGKDTKTLIKNADKALYQAKVNGKDRTVIWGSHDPSVREAPFRDAG
jgi:diguanylate cyclase (GGDEF)-like protein